MACENQNVVRQLTQEICNYLRYLQEVLGYRITLHQIEGQVNESWHQLLAYNYHDCAVCREIKASSKAWLHCVNRQQKLMEHLQQSTPLIGTCYAGVSEYVYPLINLQNQLLGFLCVSGYTFDRQLSLERACATAAKYGLCRKKLSAAVNLLSDHPPDLEMLSAQMAPLQSMFRSLFYFSSTPIVAQEASGSKKLYQDLLHYANGHFRSPDLSLRQACRHFNLSYSYASHLFAAHNGLSFARYIRTMRIETAKRYLQHTTLPISFISSECGFSDSNYFASIFKAETDFTPSAYRIHCGQPATIENQED